MCCCSSIVSVQSASRGAFPLHSAPPSQSPATSVNITNTPVAESAGPVLSTNIFYLTLTLELSDLTFYNVIHWERVCVFERLIEML